MLKKYFRISFRHLLKSKLYAVINIAGMAAGITCMLLAVLYWKDEHSYDDFHQNNPHLYRITTTLVEGKGERPVTTGGTGQVQGPAFKDAIPEVKSFTRILGGDIFSDVIAGDKTLHLQTLFVDTSFFDLFSFRLLRGSRATALNEVSAVVLTESSARKFFNSIDVIGRVLQLDADPSFQRLGKPLIVTGVVEDPPHNTSLRFDALFTFEFFRLSFTDSNWLNAYLGTFVVLGPDANVNEVTRKFNQVYALHAKEQLAENFKLYGFDPKVSYGLQPITDIHLNPLHQTTGNAEAGIINASDPVYSYMFMGIALFILVMAGINFVNITIAGSLKRAKEVGIRKLVGGSRLHIILQFMNESAIVCLLAFVLSLAAINLLLPFFNDVTGKRLLLTDAFEGRSLLYFLVVLAGIILFTGVYPAWLLSRFRPVEALYNRQKLSGKGLLGSSLVVIQFSLAVFLLIAAIVYHRQMDFIRNKDLGYNPHQVIRTSIAGDRDYTSVVGFMKNELSKESSILSFSFGSDGYPDKLEVNGRRLNIVLKKIDENFLPLMEIPLKLGRHLDAASSSDKRDGVIVNEAFVESAGLLHPLGTLVKVRDAYEDTMKSIVGVVKDFHFGSLREPIKPMLMYMSEVPEGSLWVKFNRLNQAKAMAALESAYRKTMPSAVYQYAFLDELNARQYTQEQRWQKLITLGTLLSFLICCLGLFGLAHLATQQRVKEISIRKVLGASVSEVVALLSRDFLKLVLIAIAIAAPVAWLSISHWLQDFAYRIDLGMGVFLIAGSVALFIAFAAVSYQAIRTALGNPVKSLRME